MKLYQIPRNSRINVECNDGSSFITFERIDGMYSYCTTEKGNVMHLSAITPLIEVDNGAYEIAPQSNNVIN